MSRDYFNVLARLACGHSTTLLAGKYRIGEDVFCRRCNRLTTVRELPPEYAYKCRDCRAGRQYGAAKITAQLGRDRHLRKYPAHRVLLLLDGEVVDERQLQTVIQPLPFGVDEPPF